MSIKNNNSIKYGLFYKSQGRWVGPYQNKIGNKQEMLKTNRLVKSSLKAKTSLRQLKFV